MAIVLTFEKWCTSLVNKSRLLLTQILCINTKLIIYKMATKLTYEKWCTNQQR